MRLLIQRVRHADLHIQQQLYSSIEQGLVVFLGIHQTDHPSLISSLGDKLLNLRIFSDAAGKMNHSVQEIQGEVLLVSQFTLYANCQRGRRPDFLQAAPAQQAKELYEEFILYLRSKLTSVQTGEFGADMQITLCNDGPATFWLEST